MIVRKIKPSELRRTEEMFAVSFDYPYLNKLSSEELYKKYTDHPTSREEEYCLERYAAFEDDDKTMMSCFITHPYQVQFDGQQELMYSIGGVSTLPQYRKRGGIRACFELALPSLYEKGAVFSYLYPFSTSFYRKFGYELCCRAQAYSVDLKFIPHTEVSGRNYLVDRSTKADAREDISKIYSHWQKKYNMMVEEIGYDHAFIETADPYKNQEFTFVYRSAEEEPLAYVTFKNDTDPAQRIIRCSRLVYKNAEGLFGILNLFRTYASDYRRVEFTLPMGFALEQILPEWAEGAVKCKLESYGMVRVINVKKALEDARYKGDGEAAIKVEDAFIKENNKTFHVKFKEGRCVDIYEDDSKGDVELSISAFSALLTGVWDSEYVTAFNGVKVERNLENIEKIFYKKPTHIMSYF